MRLLKVDVEKCSRCPAFFYTETSCDHVEICGVTSKVIPKDDPKPSGFPKLCPLRRKEFEQ